MKTTALFGLAAILALSVGGGVRAQDSELLVFDYPGFERPEFHGAYVERYGASPTFSFFGDEEEAFQKIRSGFQTDVTSICAGSVPKWQESGLIEPWDTSRITDYANLDANLTGTSVGAGGEVYFLPTYFGTTAIAYNPDEVPAEDVASLEVFKNPKYAGRIALPDNVDDAWALAYLATGVTDWTNVTDAQFEAAAQWLREVHPNLRTYWTDPAELAQLMSTGEVLVAWAWNETFPTMKEEGRPIGFQREPQEGSSIWLCGLVNMVNGPGSEDKVYDYVNAFLAPSSTAALASNGWGHANAVALAEQIPADVLEASGIGQISAPIFAQLPISIESRERHAQTFEEIKAGF
ncbi:ABC transporter substrate-binding protein [Rubellimicrobium arenae]|uniref:ABC transporter substrate-binding protein n=1 Tax=Rubellimicrobium arenae TaxID=2817372 RepID=UPI001B301155|nr:ABC transporter substrate-binding protein [Rubellimicrobium arenae]